jgi:hypothetical protein
MNYTVNPDVKVDNLLFPTSAAFPTPRTTFSSIKATESNYKNKTTENLGLSFLWF